MPVSPDGILQAEFDIAWAAVRLVVDGGMWPAPVDAITITRIVAGVADTPVRGIEARAVVGGYFVGSDPETPQQSTVTYRVDGTADGEPAASAAVSVMTDGAAPGMWLKVPGQPDLTVRVPIRSVSETDSPTIGGLYQVANGGVASQSAAQWSGMETDQATVVLAASTGQMLARLRSVLAASRILLLQPIGTTDLDPGWYFVSNVRRVNPAERTEDFPQRWVTLSVQRTGVPAGAGQGLAGVSWATVLDSYATWGDLMAARPAWFDVTRGA